jgi:hypothetical protein
VVLPPDVACSHGHYDAGHAARPTPVRCTTTTAGTATRRGGGTPAAPAGLVDRP